MTTTLTLFHVNGISRGLRIKKCSTNVWPRTSSVVAKPHTFSSFSPASTMRRSRPTTTPNGNNRSSTPMCTDGSWSRSNVFAVDWQRNALLSKSNRNLTITLCGPAPCKDMDCEVTVVFSSWSTRMLSFVWYTSSAICSSCPAIQNTENHDRN